MRPNGVTDLGSVGHHPPEQTAVPPVGDAHPTNSGHDVADGSRHSDICRAERAISTAQFTVIRSWILENSPSLIPLTFLMSSMVLNGRAVDDGLSLHRADAGQDVKLFLGGGVDD